MAVPLKRAGLLFSLKRCLIPQRLVIFIILLLVPQISFMYTPVLNPKDVLSLSDSHCVVAISNNYLEQTTHKHSSASNLQAIADVAFENDKNVFVGVCDLNNFEWSSGKPVDFDGEISEVKAVVFPRLIPDRSCLQKPAYYAVYPESVGYTGPEAADTFVAFVNEHCQTFRRSNGKLTVEGLHRNYLLDNLFSVGDLPASVPISQIFRNSNTNQHEHCLKPGEGGNIHCSEKALKISELFKDIPKCERIPMPSKDDFFNNYLFRSRPVIITGAMQNWTALSKWTNEFLRKNYGKKEVHLKLTPSGEYEGIEQAAMWESYRTFKIPDGVLKQLPYPDLVVVRPAGVALNFSDFLDFMNNVSRKAINVSAYLEYTSMSDYFPELKDDIAAMPFLHDLLKLAHLNIWLSDGNTLGKAHFDPFDNFLCQIDGAKEVIIFEPHNDFLYEAHIPEAILSYNSTLKKFRRSKLLDSTSMVMTPVDILHPNLERFPKFGSARPISCTIHEGDVLFMPAFWWHEVQSRPSLTKKRNMAVNFWYDPVFKKEFPCRECHLDVNFKYKHLL